MTYWRTSRSDLGGRHEHPTGSPRAVTPRDLNSFPLQPVLHREDACDAPLNVGDVIRDAILGSVAAVAIVVSFYILIFVRVG